jgi:hypothetical protein
MAYKKQSPQIISEGGTDVQSTTAYGVLCGGTTSTGALQNAGPGGSGQVLTSSGSSALPFWQLIGGTGSEILLNTTTQVINPGFVWSNSLINDTYEWYKVVVNNFEFSGSIDEAFGIAPVPSDSNPLSGGNAIPTAINLWAYNSPTVTHITPNTGEIFYAPFFQNKDVGQIIMYFRLPWPSNNGGTILYYFATMTSRNLSQGGTYGSSYGTASLNNPTIPIGHINVGMYAAGTQTMTVSLYGIQQ